MIFDLSNKTIIVTGAGSGIGQETARILSTSGARLVLLDVNETGLSETLDSINGEFKAIVCDLCDFERLPDIVASICAEIGIIHGFVHCAGISSRKPLKMLSPKGFSKILNVNFFAFEEIIRLLMKKGRFTDGGSVVVMSSISSIKGYKAKTEYCVSKAAVDAFVRCMAAELAHRRIRINSIMAAEVLTPLALKARVLNESLDVDLHNPPLGPTAPYEVANTIAFLLSDATKTITGTAIVIDGGALIE